MNQFLIVCPLLFLAGFLDAIGGGGGLISLPAYLLAGVPVHNAIATNKLSSACGTTLTTVRFIRQGMVNWKIAVPTIVFAITLVTVLGDGLDKLIICLTVVNLPSIARLVRSQVLSIREKEIMRLRFGLGGIQERTQKEVADTLGISQSYISRLEKKIMRRLRKKIEEKI